MIELNGEPTEVEPDATLANVLALLGLSMQSRGVAVAVDGAVVQRALWDTYKLAPDAHIEVLTAMQGG
ncbi:MAG TPA: sulfur carrier protein ThiS [Solirubrobacteraceae bacterium]|nr:sulfur carrier protein ThiS [Solirubrobacteraceae bacterium]